MLLTLLFSLRGSLLVLLVAVFLRFPLLEVLVTLRGEPLGEFFSNVVKDSSLRLVCGVLPGPGAGEVPPATLGAGDGD